MLGILKEILAGVLPGLFLLSLSQCVPVLVLLFLKVGLVIPDGIVWM